MFNLEFILEGNVITIQIDGNEPMKKATEKFFIKTNSEIDYAYFLYNGDRINLNEKISNIARPFDRENKKMQIIALVFEEEFFRKDIKNIIFPSVKKFALLI